MAVVAARDRQFVTWKPRKSAIVESSVALEHPCGHTGDMVSLNPSFALAAAALTFGLTPSAASANSPPVNSVEAAAAASEVNPVAMSLASAIVDLGYPEEQRESLFFGTMDQTVAQLRSSLGNSLPLDDAGAMEIFDRWLEKYTDESKQVLRKHIPSIMQGMTSAYAKIFTVEELSDILAFVETPSGRKFFELSPAVMGDANFASANQRYLDESMRLLGPAQRELMDDLKAYMAESEAIEGTTQS